MLLHVAAEFFQKSFLQPHQLGGDGEAGAVLLGQFHFDGLGVLDRPQGSGQVLWSHLQTNLIVLRGHALHLVLIEEVGLRGGRYTLTGSAGRILSQAGSFSLFISSSPGALELQSFSHL